MRAASGERRRCLRSETVDCEAAEPGPFPGARCDGFGSGDDEELSRLHGGADLRMQIDDAVLVLFPCTGGAGGIALREQARRAGRWPGVRMRRLERRVDELPVFRAGDVTDRGLVERHQQRRDQGQQRECGADSGTDPMQACADQDARLTLATRGVFTGLAISRNGRSAAPARWPGSRSFGLFARTAGGAVGLPSDRAPASAPVLVAPGAGLPSSAIGTRHPQCKDALAPAASAGATVAWTDSTGYPRSCQASRPPSRGRTRTIPRCRRRSAKLAAVASLGQLQ